MSAPTDRQDPDPASGDGDPGPPWRDRLPSPGWWLPILVGLCVVVATTFRISGTSVAELTPSPGDDSGILVGSPRPIRSDEWAVRTPFIVGQAERGYPRTMPVGVGAHDASVLYDLPVRDWPTVFRPHLLGYLLLGVERGFAFEWALLAASVLLGVYALVGVSTRRLGWAAVAALATYGSPFIHWWYLPATLGTLGYGTGATAALLWAVEQTDLRRRWAATALGTYLLACFAMFFYPPFQVPLLWALAAWVVGTLASPRWRPVWSWRRLLQVLVPVGAGVVVVMGAFVVTRADAIAAITGTVYPGDRRATGGDGPLGLLTSAWLGFSYLADATGLRGKVFPNESEGSSFLLLALFALPALPVVWRRIAGRSAPARWPLVAMTALCVVLVAHCFVGLPSPVLAATLLDRVPANRALIGLGLGSVLLLVALGMALEAVDVARWRRLVAGVVTVAVVGGYVWTLGGQLRDAGAPIDVMSIAVPTLLAAAIGALVFVRPFLAAVASAVFGLVVSVPVNPLYVGLAPARTSAFVRAVQQADRTRPAGRAGWIASGDQLTTEVTAAGVTNLSGVNLYPDDRAWGALDPSGAARDVWNRYSHTIWTLTPGVGPPQLALLQADLLSITLDPCDEALDELGVGHVASATAIAAPCLRLESRSVAPSGAPAFVYERRPSR